jgi:3' terminal RNA ribose 2'-O-methyltransferase Hen1
VLDSSFTDWGDSPYRTVALRRVGPLHELLGHLYVLVPVLDNEKHYWVGDDELEKLLRHGEGWLGSHPEREAIVARYLKHQSRLTRAALSRLAEEDHADPDAEEASHDHEEEAVEERISLHTQRLGAVLSVLKASGAHSVLDLGCGEGKLVRLLAAERQFNQIVGVDVSHRALQIAAERLRPDRRPSPVVSGTTHADAAGTSEPRIRLLHGSLAYRDQRLKGFDAAAIVEVIEHLDPPRLAAFERVVFEFARPRTVVLTTPNAEYNVRFETLPAGRFRHRDHRFEWTRAEFQAWARRVAERFGYTVRFLPVGPEDTQVGAPTQMGVFEAAETAASR